MSEEQQALTGNCKFGARKPCSCACPVNFDVDGFIRKLKAGSLKSAQRLLSVGLVFPGLVCELCSRPCAKVCPCGVDLRQMERSCNALQTAIGPARYTVPKQNKSVAVVGSGISGLACAQKLAARNYDVTVFERGGDVGGTLIDIFGKERCEAEFRRQFAYAPYTLKARTEIKSLDELFGFDAVYIATGSGGDDFGLTARWNKQSKATDKPGVFLGGELVSDSKMDALADGIVASASIEYYLRSGRMDGEPSKFIQSECRLPVEPQKISQSDSEDRLLSKEELIAAAKDCRLCDCTFCTDGCEFLKWFGLGPKKLEESMKNAQAATSGYIQRQGTRAAYSCGLCGHCGRVCPERIGFEELLLETKQKLFQNEKFPEVLHDFFTQDMLTAQTADFLARTAPGFDSARYMLFPGCQEVKTAPEHVKKAYAYMLELYPDTALMLGCCGVPALWAGNQPLFSEMLDRLKAEWGRLGKPTAVLMCPTCAKTLKKYLPEITFISIYEIIAENKLPANAVISDGREFAIFDPCASAGFPDFQNAVRNLSELLGYQIREMPDSREKASCCGMGGHVYPTNRQVATAALKRAMEKSPLDYICYCGNCRSLFVLGGKSCRHILDDVFGVAPTVKPTHLAQMEENRRLLKDELLNLYWGETPEREPEPEPIKLVITEELYLKMDAALISETKIKELLRLCELEQRKLFVPEHGTWIAHRQIGHITYWAEYEPCGDNTFRVLNAYCHKISIHD